MYRRRVGEHSAPAQFLSEEDPSTLTHLSTLSARPTPVVSVQEDVGRLAGEPSLPRRSAIWTSVKRTSNWPFDKLLLLLLLLLFASRSAFDQINGLLRASPPNEGSTVHLWVCFCR